MSRSDRRSGKGRSGGRVSPKKEQAGWRGSVLWVAPLFNPSGYGEEARGFLRALDKSGVNLVARSNGEDSSVFVDSLRESPEMAITLDRLLSRQPAGPVATVLHLPGAMLHRPGGSSLVVGRTMFETDGLPAGWADRLNLLDEVWVPSSFNVDTFRAAGVHAPIHVVPGGVDASQFRPGLPPLRIDGIRGTSFLAVFEWSHRKAPDVLLRAWAMAFRPTDPVSLVLRCYTRSDYAGDATQVIEALVDYELALAGYTRADVAPIVIIGRQLSPAEMPRLVANADVFVGVSRGEGWGRPLMEAMSCGIPAIGTRWGGNVEFMDDSNSLLVDIDGLVEVDDRMDAAFYRGQRWAEPSVEHLAELMRRAIGDENLRRSLGRKARSDVERRWQWHQVSRTVLSRLRELTQGSASGSRPQPSTPEMAPVRIRWFGDVYADHGLATVNREVLSRLSGDRNLTVEAVTTEVPPFPPDNVAALREVPGAGAKRGSGSVAVEVRHFWPPDFSRPAEGKLVSILPWEYGGIPQEWIEPIRQAVDEIWVPSSWVRECYIRSGIPHDKVAVIPNGVDTRTYTPEGPKLTLKTNRTRKLLFVGGAIYRKGFDLLLDAYLEAFGPDDDVCLVVKPFGSDSVYEGSSMEERLLDAAANSFGPAVEMIDRRLSRAELAMLYRSCDAIVHPYRGEGFGLPVAEAMGCGVPAVVTGYGACLDFCDDTTGWLIPADEVPGTMVDWTAGPAGFWWAEPDAGQLKELLRHVVGVDDSELKKRGVAARQRIVESFAWEQAADCARQRLAALANQA